LVQKTLRQASKRNNPNDKWPKKVRGALHVPGCRYKLIYTMNYNHKHLKNGRLPIIFLVLCHYVNLPLCLPLFVKCLLICVLQTWARFKFTSIPFCLNIVQFWQVFLNSIKWFWHDFLRSMSTHSLNGQLPKSQPVACTIKVLRS
jgi:hypothetical protein